MREIAAKMEALTIGPPWGRRSVEDEAKNAGERVEPVA